MTPALLIAATLTTPTADAWGPTTAGFRMAIRLPDGPRVKVGEPVRLEVLVENATDRKLFLCMSSEDLPAFGFRVAYTGGGAGVGGPVPTTRFAAWALRPMASAKNIPIEVEPGQAMTYTLPLARLIDVTTAGTYTVEVTRKLPDGPGTLASNVLGLEVVEDGPSIRRGRTGAPAR